jgi:hypothetical protein
MKNAKQSKTVATVASKTASKTAVTVATKQADAPKIRATSYTVNIPLLAAWEDRPSGMCAGFRRGSAIAAIVTTLADGKPHAVNTLAESTEDRAQWSGRESAIRKHAAFFGGKDFPKHAHGARLERSADGKTVQLVPLTPAEQKPLVASAR